MFKGSFLWHLKILIFNHYFVTLSKCCDISINDKHVVYFARAMCEINNNDVGRYLVFTGMIQRLHCDWIQWTERRNNKRYKVALIRIQYFSIKTTGKSSRNKLNQNLVFPITSFSCCVGGIIVARFVQPVSRGKMIRSGDFTSFYPGRQIVSKRNSGLK